MVAPHVWIERLSALHRNLLRKFAAEEGLQLVHIEVLQYLSICNHYSDTARALTEYLGQTKGSISQSLAHLEEQGFVKRVQDKADKRSFHLSLTPKSRKIVARLDEALAIDITGGEQAQSLLKNVLRAFQQKNEMRSFGVCATCKYNQSPSKDNFHCGLTNEALTAEQTSRICREHE